MRLNRIEFAMMNNPIRGAVQRYVEAKKLLRMGGAMNGGRALELGCGRGVGAGLILDLFGADSVDAFDLDPAMAIRARARLAKFGSRARLWVGDAGSICVSDAIYDAVFDFGIIHHVPDWRAAVKEIQRVLKPGGRFYAEEVLRGLITHPLSRRLFLHPQEDRFGASEFARELEAIGMDIVSMDEFQGLFAWFVAQKRATNPIVGG